MSPGGPSSDVKASSNDTVASFELLCCRRLAPVRGVGALTIVLDTFSAGHRNPSEVVLRRCKTLCGWHGHSANEQEQIEPALDSTSHNPHLRWWLDGCTSGQDVHVMHHDHNECRLRKQSRYLHRRRQPQGTGRWQSCASW